MAAAASSGTHGGHPETASGAATGQTRGGRTPTSKEPGLVDDRTLALMIARGRVVLGVVASLLPGFVARAAPGESSPGTRALARMTGARDLALGVGAVTTLKEQTQDAEWVGMGAVCDLADGVALLLTRRLPRRARLTGLGALATGAAGLFLARRLADQRTEGAATTGSATT